MNNDKPRVGCKNAFPSPTKPKDHSPECRVMRSIPRTKSASLVELRFESEKSNGQRTLNANPVPVLEELLLLVVTVVDSTVAVGGGGGGGVVDADENSTGICNFGNAWLTSTNPKLIMAMAIVETSIVDDPVTRGFNGIPNSCRIICNCR